MGPSPGGLQLATCLHTLFLFFSVLVSVSIHPLMSFLSSGDSLRTRAPSSNLLAPEHMILRFFHHWVARKTNKKGLYSESSHIVSSSLVFDALTHLSILKFIPAVSHSHTFSHMIPSSVSQLLHFPILLCSLFTPKTPESVPGFSRLSKISKKGTISHLLEE